LPIDTTELGIDSVPVREAIAWKPQVLIAVNEDPRIRDVIGVYWNAWGYIVIFVIVEY